MLAYDATLSTGIGDIIVLTQKGPFTIHFMCEYIGIRLTVYEKNNRLLKF